LFEWQQHFEPAKLPRLRDRIHLFEMKDHLSSVVLAQPARFQPYASRFALAVRISYEDFLQLSEPLRKIGKQFGGYLALIAART
jgi:hypothetical protein